MIIDISRQHYAESKHLFLFLTERCNSDCKYCYLGNKRLSNPKEINTEDAKRIIKVYKSFNVKLITLIGGEPLLHPDILKIIDFALSEGLEVILDTNGKNIENDVLISISKLRLKFLSLSIDSHDPTIHDSLRGKGSFDCIIKTLNATSELNIPLRVTAVISRRNSKQIIDLIKMLSNYDCLVLNMHRLTPSGKGQDCAELVLSPIEWYKFTKDLINNNLYIPFVVRFPPAYIKNSELKYYSAIGYEGCLARKMDSYTIMSNGDIYLCPFFMDWDLSSYNLKQGILQNIKNELDCLFEYENRCLGCRYFEKCKGFCPYYIKSKYICKPSEVVPLCPLWKIDLQSIQRYLKQE